MGLPDVTDSVAAALFNVFFSRWCEAVTAERFPPVGRLRGGQRRRAWRPALLDGDDLGWFPGRPRASDACRRRSVAALDELPQALGPDMAGWTWGRLHTLLQKHFLSGRGDLGQLLDRSGLPVRGDGTTVCSSTPDAEPCRWHRRRLPHGRRPRRSRSAACGPWKSPASSGHPGSPHYDDQLEPWSEGKYHYTSLLQPTEGKRLTLEP